MSDLLNNHRTNTGGITKEELMDFGLHSGLTTHECQRCGNSMCEAHTIVYRDSYDRQELCARYSKPVVGS